MAYRTLSTLLLAIGLAMASHGARADSTIAIDLNKLEARDGACRAYFVLENGTDRDFSGFTLDLFLFDTSGVVAKRIVADSAPLTPTKTRVRLVDFRDLTCDQISLILINDVIDCRDASGDRDDCANLLVLSNRTAAKFIK